VVDGAELLDEISAFVRKYVSLTAAQATAVSLWTMHSHAIDAADATGYLSVTSAEKQSGKTRLLEVLELIVHKPWYTTRTSAAVLVRKLSSESPTLLLDESDAAFKSGEEYAEALRGILNGGHRRGGVASLCVGKDNTPTDFSIFGAKIIAGIGRLPDTVADRSIPIRLKRKSAAEPVCRFRRRKVEPEAAALRDRLASWSASHLDELRDAEPKLPEEISDRAQDCTEPMLAIADLVGGDWPERARAAVIELCTGELAKDQTTRIELLRDIRLVFEEKAVDRISSEDMLAGLNAMAEHQWCEFHGKPLTARGLAKLLADFDVASKQLKIAGAKVRGFDRADFSDAWSRYLVVHPVPAVPANIHAGPDAISHPVPEAKVPDKKSEESPVNTRVVPHVPDKEQYTAPLDEKQASEVAPVVKKVLLQ
jgi:hypothetical protein